MTGSAHNREGSKTLSAPENHIPLGEAAASAILIEDNDEEDSAELTSPRDKKTRGEELARKSHIFFINEDIFKCLLSWNQVFQIFLEK